MNAFEQRLLDKLKKADELAEKTRPAYVGVSPHPPEKPYVKELQKRNHFYEEVFGVKKGEE